MLDFLLMIFLNSNEFVVTKSDLSCSISHFCFDVVNHFHSWKALIYTNIILEAFKLLLMKFSQQITLPPIIQLKRVDGQWHHPTVGTDIRTECQIPYTRTEISSVGTSQNVTTFAKEMMISVRIFCFEIIFIFKIQWIFSHSNALFWSLYVESLSHKFTACLLVVCK